MEEQHSQKQKLTRAESLDRYVTGVLSTAQKSEQLQQSEQQEKSTDKDRTL